MRPLHAVLFAALSALLSACGPGQLDDPCTSDEDCEESLMCDFHEDETDGSCQEPHQH